MPDGQNPITDDDPRAELVQRICNYIESNLDETLTLEALGEFFNFSPYHLQRTFKGVMGITPRQYADACRVSRLKSRLRGGATVTDALYDVGYGSSSRLYEQSDAHLGMTPSTYGKGGKGMAIRYSVVTCPLGWVLVAATERGVCKIGLGDEAESLEKILRDEFPAAEITPDDEGLGAWVGALVGYLGGQLPHLDLPLDIRGTAFQRRVWEELRRIPYGETRTYSEIAAAIGNPKAVRAVGSACGANPVAPVVPCHRAVRTDGGMGGYRWGLERKEALLEMEKGKEKV